MKRLHKTTCVIVCACLTGRFTKASKISRGKFSEVHKPKRPVTAGQGKFYNKDETCTVKNIPQKSCIVKLIPKNPARDLRLALTNYRKYIKLLKMRYRINIRPRPFEHQRLFAMHKVKPCSHREVECEECGAIIPLQPDFIDRFYFQNNVTPDTYTEYRDAVRKAIIDGYPDREEIRDGAVSISFTFCNPDKRCDIDNLCKAVGDAIQDRVKKDKNGKALRDKDGKKIYERGALLYNDNQIKANHGSKIIYDKASEPYVEFQIIRLKGGDGN